jgi:hypothetical protein
MKGITRGERNVRWIENYCVQPDGLRKGEHVRLSPEQYEIVCRIYDEGPNTAPTGELAAYLALLHVCGPEAVRRADVRLPLAVDTWTVWRATSPDLQAVLKREGAALVCPKLGTRYPAAA